MTESMHTILIVDDEIFIRQSFCDYFEDQLWRTILAESGEQALEILEQESPDAAVVDIRMGGMDGDAFILKAHKIKPEMAFVICTGSPEYYIPDALREVSTVSRQLFKKPLTDLSRLEEELLRLIAAPLE